MKTTTTWPIILRPTDTTKDDVLEIKTMDLDIWKWNTMVMKEATRFGRRISFIGNPQVVKK